MLICIPDILSKDQVIHARTLLNSAPWEDGRSTAGAQSASVKVNHQLPLECDEAQSLGRIILDALWRNPMFLSAALPSKMMPPLFNRYSAGQTFGIHVDNAIRLIPQTGERIRTDLSMTLFLSEPDEYDGGELVIETLYGSQEIKLPAGHLVLYPATSLHQVLPITRGARMASFFWLQSMIRDEGARTMLFDLDQTIQSFASQHGLDNPHAVKLTGIYHNLIRHWADL